MPENKQEQESPFSPLQTGCAVVMLSNMLIYLGVVAFVFNMLDPSRLDASYLARRGFTAREEKENPQDRAFRRATEERREDQLRVQREGTDTPRRPGIEETSPAAQLSELSTRPHASSMPEQREFPAASRIAGTTPGRGGGSRRYDTTIFSQSAFGRFYSPFRLYTLRLISPEQYEPMPVQIAQQIRFPSFGLPDKELQDIILYDIPNPVPDPVRGEPRFSAPAEGAVTYYTNYLRQTGRDLQNADDEQKNSQ